MQQSEGIFSKEHLRSNIPSGIERSSLVRWPNDDDYDDDNYLEVEVEKREEDSDFIGPENRRIDHNSPALINRFF